jgi:hypothetical protein
MIRNALSYCIILGLTANVLAVRQQMYEIDEMPIVDAHTHFNGQSDFQNAADKMDQWGGVLTVTLAGDRGTENDFDFIANSLDGRIITAIRAGEISNGLPWSMDDIQYFADAGYSGFKVWVQYIQPLSTIPDIDLHFDKMGEVGLPLLGLHIGDPPEGEWSVPEKYMLYHLDAEEVIHRHPNTTFIMAHMYWLICNDTSIDTLSMFFDRNPNLYGDLGATFQYFDPPQPSYEKIRDFLIKYKDRILFGTDGGPGHSVGQWNNAREMLETDIENAQPFFGSGSMKGLDLPLDVLNHIYYWNAAQLIPGVKEALEGLGYEIGDEPPTTDTAVAVKHDPAEHPFTKYSSETQNTMLLNLQGKAIATSGTGRADMRKGAVQSLSPGVYLIYTKTSGRPFIEKTLLLNK